MFEYPNIRHTLMLSVEVTQCFLVSFPFSPALIRGFSSGALCECYQIKPKWNFYPLTRPSLYWHCSPPRLFNIITDWDFYTSDPTFTTFANSAWWWLYSDWWRKNTMKHNEEEGNNVQWEKWNIFNQLNKSNIFFSVQQIWSCIKCLSTALQKLFIRVCTGDSLCQVLGSITGTIIPPKAFSTGVHHMHWWSSMPSIGFHHIVQAQKHNMMPWCKLCWLLFSCLCSRAHLCMYTYVLFLSVCFENLLFINT